MSESTEAFHLVVVGAGNIGSHLIPHLARMVDVKRVTIIDRDIYEAKNHLGQDISSADVGHPKARAQARRLRRINPCVAVRPIHGDVELLPPGLLLGDAILAGVDNRRARQYLNETAWQLGVPWIDAAVDGAGLLARVGVYVPGQNRPCLECGWNDSDYAALEQRYPCDGDGRPSEPKTPAATQAPSALGAMAATLQIFECRDLLSRRTNGTTDSRQIFFDLRHHRYYYSSLGRNMGCRRADHDGWRPAPLDLDPRLITIGDLLRGKPAALHDAIREHGPYELRVNRHHWIRRMICSSCGAVRATPRLLRGALLDLSLACPRCSGRMQASGLDLATSLADGMLSEPQKRRSLHALGIRRGDILTMQRADGALFRRRVTGDGE